MSISKTSLLILGLVSENPLSPYEMNKVLGKINIQKWFPLSESSIYATVRTLERNGMISGHPVKEGNMPEKTVYGITKKGSQNFIAALREYLSDKDVRHTEFDLGLLFVCHLEKENALSILQNKHAKMVEEISVANNYLLLAEQSSKISFIGKLLIKHALKLKTAELETVQEAIQEIEKIRSWDHFVTNDIGY